jgi:bifunctional DNase/RNase
MLLALIISGNWYKGKRMRSLWKLGLIILIAFVATGCVRKMITEQVAGAPSDSTPSGDGELYEVTVKRVVMGYVSGGSITSVIVLANKENKRQVLPILVGISEGTSIDRALNKVVSERPGTHDLFASVLGQFHTKLVKVVVTDLREDTYIATMTMQSYDEMREIDARPSDAIALALRCAAPVFVSERVIRKGGWMKVPQQDEKQSKEEKKDNLL